jgi:hypothetical protein
VPAASAHAFFPPSLRRLSRRAGTPPRIDRRYPCPQLEATAPEAIRARLQERAGRLPSVSVEPTRLSVPGRALVLDEELAKGKPEAFVSGREIAVLRPDGSVQLNLDPIWGEKVLDRGWATIHPLARYLAGALPPQSAIVYAPRDDAEIAVVLKILEAAHCLAVGRIGDLVLPDTGW